MRSCCAACSAPVSGDRWCGRLAIPLRGITGAPAGAADGRRTVLFNTGAGAIRYPGNAGTDVNRNPRHMRFPARSAIRDGDAECPIASPERQDASVPHKTSIACARGNIGKSGQSAYTLRYTSRPRSTETRRCVRVAGLPTSCARLPSRAITPATPKAPRWWSSAIRACCATRPSRIGCPPGSRAVAGAG